jgi:hypothetical protein
MAGTVTQTLWMSPDRKTARLTISWLASADDGSVPVTSITSTLITKLLGMKLKMMKTNPGTVAPTDAYNITLIDADGLDVLGGAGATRDGANSEICIPVISGIASEIPITDEVLSFTLTGNSVNSAVGVAKFIFVG